MNREQAKEYIQAHPEHHLQAAKKRGTYICPLCGNGQGADGDGLTAKDGIHWHCFKCNFHGDIIELIAAERGIADGGSAEAFEVARQEYGIAIDDSSAPAPAPARIAPEPPQPEKRADYSEYIARAQEALKSSEAGQTYLQARGIKPETAARFMLGYDAGKIVIPYGRGGNYYITRSIEGKRYTKPKTEEAGAEPLYNAAALTAGDHNAVFVVEGTFCAISIMQEGGAAVALNSTGYRKLLDALEAAQIGKTLILCLDNDESGRQAQRGLAEALRAAGAPFIEYNIAGQYKDPNERLQADAAGFADAVRAAAGAATKPDNTLDYINSIMGDEIGRFVADSTRKTGFSNLDTDEAAGGLYTGLYVIGALSSLGKTTFVLQMADQMAEAGEDVLFFSLEQSRLELVCKSIARTMAQRDARTAKTALQLRKGQLTPEALDAVREYGRRVGDRVSIIECNFTMNTKAIGERIEQFKRQNGGKKPVVIIDYLQVLQGEQRQSAREVVEMTITELKQISRRLDVPIIVVSSLNRSNYLTPIDFQSFKESGLIEFTADVVWGLQYRCLSENPVFDKGEQTGIKEKRKVIREAKAENPRQIQLICLKNRFGRDFDATFSYYPANDLFKPAEGANR